MEPTMLEVVFIGVAALAGAMFTALLGYTESQYPFNPKKFLSSVIRGLVGAVGIAALWDWSGSITGVSYLLAIIAGAGVDVGGNRIAGAISARFKQGHG